MIHAYLYAQFAYVIDQEFNTKYEEMYNHWRYYLHQTYDYTDTKTNGSDVELLYFQWRLIEIIERGSIHWLSRTI